MTSYGDSTGPNSSCAGNPSWTAPVRLGEAARRAIHVLHAAEARRAEAGVRDQACPECAEKDAEIERLKAQVASGLPTLTSSAMAGEGKDGA